MSERPSRTKKNINYNDMEKGLPNGTSKRRKSQNGENSKKRPRTNSEGKNSIKFTQTQIFQWKDTPHYYVIHDEIPYFDLTIQKDSVGGESNVWRSAIPKRMQDSFKQFFVPDANSGTKPVQHGFLPWDNYVRYLVKRWTGDLNELLLSIINFDLQDKSPEAVESWQGPKNKSGQYSIPTKIRQTRYDDEPDDQSTETHKLYLKRKNQVFVSPEKETRPSKSKLRIPNPQPRFFFFFFFFFKKLIF
jgi:hypothetical protein